MVLSLFFEKPCLESSRKLSLLNNDDLQNYIHYKNRLFFTIIIDDSVWANNHENLKFNPVSILTVSHIAVVHFVMNTSDDTCPKNTMKSTCLKP